MPKTHYEVLGVSPAATYEEIKSAYKSAALASHPDKLVRAHGAAEVHHTQHAEMRPSERDSAANDRGRLVYAGGSWLRPKGR